MHQKSSFSPIKTNKRLAKYTLKVNQIPLNKALF